VNQSGKLQLLPLAAICAAALLLGMAGRAALHADPSRSDEMLAMFEDWCLPRLSGVAREPAAPLQALAQIPGEVLWVDPDSMIALKTSPKDCRVTDVLLPLGPQQADRFTETVKERVGTWAPTLRLDITATVEGWDAFLFWLSTPDLSDPQRWGILLSRFAASGDGSTTDLILALPRVK
jgi:hypothetical protein